MPFHAIHRVDIGGSDLTNYLSKLLRENDHSFRFCGDFEIVKEIKENNCHVSLDFVSEMSSQSSRKEYTLCDGKVIKLGKERMKCPEVYFQPSLLGREVLGIHQMVYNTLQKCESDVKKDLYGKFCVFVY